MSTDIELLPSSVAAFTEALKGERGSLDAWLEVNDEREVAAHVEAYARANVAHATAPLQAEIEELRADVEAWKASHSLLTDTCHHFQARAERLAEALRHLRNHTSVNSHQIELIDAALRDHDQENDQ